MAYHIDTGLIKEKFKVDCECPLCEIQAIVEEQFLHEFLNDAVMEEGMRGKVNKFGFCSRHFDMLFIRQNKLSVALQIASRMNTILDHITDANNVKSALKQAEKLESDQSTCIICNLAEESMEKYYRTIAEMYKREPNFRDSFRASKGFCLPHYIQLLKYAKYAGGEISEFLSDLTEVEQKNMLRLRAELKIFCDKHDYRNALMPLGSAETALPRTRTKLYGKKFK